MQIKWWSRKDLHKAGLLWGKFNLNMSDCSFHQEEDIATKNYTKSQKFFFGQVTAGLVKNWTIDLTDSVSDVNYDYNTILFSLHQIAENIVTRNPTVWSQSITNISIVIGSLMQSLFPNNQVSNDYANVYELLNRTRALYSDVETFSTLVDNVEKTFNLTVYIESKVIISQNRGFSSAGFLWEKMNQMLIKSANATLGEQPDLQTRMLVSGRFY